MKNIPVNNLRIAIVGGGPVGLTTAKILQQNGASVTVYERDENANSRITGGTLDIHKGTGQDALKKAGVLAAYYQHSRPTRERRADITGAILKDELPTEEDKYERPEIDRNDLRMILLESLEEGTVVWNSQVLNVTKEDNSYKLTFANGPEAGADFVIVANGGRSKVREQVTGAVPNYTGSFIIQGEVFNPDVDCPNYKELCADGNLVVFGERKILSSQTKGNGAIVFYVSFREAESWAQARDIDFSDKTAVTNVLLRLFETWDDRYKELFRASSDFTGLAMKKMPLDEAWKQHRNITLVGDAAHLMPPYAGQGVNIGLLDALCLTDNLTNGTFADLQAAVDDYERKMVGYAATAQTITSVLEQKSHAENALQEIEAWKNEFFKQKTSTQ